MEEHNQISALPDDVFRYIFSNFFTRKQLASTLPLVSKRWHLLVQSCRIILLCYNFKSFCSKSLDKEFSSVPFRDRRASEEPFFESIQESIQESIRKYPATTIRVIKIQLVEVYGLNPTPLNNLLNSLPEFKCKELLLEGAHSRVLSVVLKNSNFLKFLHLNSCSFDWDKFDYFYGKSILASLQELVLEDFDIYYSSERRNGNNKCFLELILEKCPSLEDLTLRNIRNCTSVDLPDHKNLKRVCIEQLSDRSTKLGRVKIGAKNLEAFRLCSYENNNSIKVDINKCQRLRSLHLQCPNRFPSGVDTTDICSVFPRLKKLYIYLKAPLPSDFSLGIVSDELERLSIWNKEDIPFPVDTPNLRSFNYVGGGILNENFAPKESSKIVKTRIELRSFDMSGFQTLRSSVAVFGKNILLCLTIREFAWFPLHQIEDDLGIHPPLRIKKLELYISDSSPQDHHKCLIDCLLWAFQPESLVFLQSNTLFEQVLLEELVDRGREQNCCKPSHVYRCWRHFLKEFKIARPPGSYVTFLFIW